jgi:hypothetical protein
MHNHGKIYRAKIASPDGRIEFSDWFDTEKELRDAMQKKNREIGKRYYCEAKMVSCTQPGCDVDQTPRVISSL